MAACGGVVSSTRPANRLSPKGGHQNVDERREVRQ
jgi:hypothetical protein